MAQLARLETRASREVLQASKADQDPWGQKVTKVNREFQASHSPQDGQDFLEIQVSQDSQVCQG